MFGSKIILAIAGISLLTLSTGCATTIPVQNTSENQSPTPVEETRLEENFSFLISDEANAIGDFESLIVTISSIGIQQGEDWKEFTPEETEFDLTELVGENAVEVWNGNLEPGTYNKVFIYVEEVSGVLKDAAEGEVTAVKLPSGKLQLSKPFTVGEDEETTFIYDVSVVKTGNGRYILKPQLEQSGSDQKFKEVEAEQEQEQEQEHENDTF
jgi:hypothetical protein